MSKEPTSSGPSFELLASIGVDLGSKLDQHHKNMESLLVRPEPARYPIFNSVNTGAAPAVPFFVSCGEVFSPSVRRIWQLTSVMLVGADDHTAIASMSAAIYAGPPTNNPNDFGSLVAVVPSGGVPYINLIGKDRVWMQPGETLYAWLYGTVPANQQITLVGNVDDYPSYAKETLKI